jgi:glycosyltransferase involved in cell wall biosynthesis
MRILVLTPTFLPAVGGAELVLWEVYRRMAERHSVMLATPFLRRRTIERYSRNETDYPVPFDVIRFEDRVTLMKLRGQYKLRGLLPPFSLSAVAALRRGVKEFAPDVVNVHYTVPTGLAAVVADRLWRVPSVLSLVGRDVPGPGVPPLWKAWHRFAARRVRGVTYISEYCRDAIGAGDGKGTVTWSGVPLHIAPSDPSGLRERLGLAAGQPVIFCLQRLAREKRVDIVLRGFRAVAGSRPDAALVVGGTGPEQAGLVETARALGISDRVRFVGFIPEADLDAHFALCDVFVFHSTYETFGIVLAQAMAHEVPVVTVDGTAIPGVVGRDGGALLVPPLDPDAVARAVLRVLADPQLAAGLARKGRARAERLFGWDTVVGRYERALEKAAGRG